MGLSYPGCHGDGIFGVCAMTASGSTTGLRVLDALGVDDSAVTLIAWIPPNANPQAERYNMALTSPPPSFFISAARKLVQSWNALRARWSRLFMGCCTRVSPGCHSLFAVCFCDHRQRLKLRATGPLTAFHQRATRLWHPRQRARR